MTIPAATWRQQHSGNDVTTSFSTGFSPIENTDVRVFLTVDATSTDTELTYGADFTVTGAGAGTAATVIMTNPPATGEHITILSDIALTQPLDAGVLDTLSAAEVMNALDRVWVAINQVSEEADRAIKSSATGSGADEVTSWTPIFAVVADGARYVVQILSWEGGTGTEPDGGYIGDTGMVATAAEATNIRGAQGVTGAGTGDLLAANNLNDMASKPTAFSNIKQAATTSATGVLEIATDAEAIAKSDTGRALVPSNLAALGSTTTFAGLVELATTAEASAGTDTARAVTPAGLDAYNTAHSQFAAGTAMLFMQTSAPTGWTKSTTHNDKALRVVSGSVSSGGSVNFSTFAARTATDAFSLSSPYLPSVALTPDNDTINYVSVPADASKGFITNASTVAYSGAGSAFTMGIDCRIKYADVIVATRD